MKNGDTDDLCCCEYYDLSNERNHILACLCNCVDLDEAVDNLVKGKKVSDQNKTGLTNTMRDRLRVPWIGGAIQVSFDSLLPVIILPLVFLVSSLSLWWTAFSFTTIGVFILLISNFFVRTIPKTKFFFVWTVTSIVLLYFIFEFVVIPFLEILVEENIALSVLIFGFIMCLYLMKLRANQLIAALDDESQLSFNGKSIEGFYACKICDCKIPDKDHHCQAQPLLVLVVVIFRYCCFIVQLEFNTHFRLPSVRVLQNYSIARRLLRCIRLVLCLSGLQHTDSDTSMADIDAANVLDFSRDPIKRLGQAPIVIQVMPGT
ncbi:hypothetical protein D910_01924 [Dendroctonus ponderosae]|uniref:Uncharacterized protein n=1 Tax=Dendroctonus ponderosae TaxID=77166 RepID=U4TSK5_DENPD|nr:hypothetical protein D910_01924 [Dendroctonus ponderosae]